MAKPAAGTILPHFTLWHLQLVQSLPVFITIIYPKKLRIMINKLNLKKMNMLKKIFTTLFIILTILSCNNQDQSKATKLSPQTENTIHIISNFTGDYVSESYSKRSEGYDWMAVSVNQLSDSSVHIMVRSRIDKKKPSCTFDADAIKISDNQFKSNIDGKRIIYTFNKNSINIAPDKNEDKDILQYYCSGGGSFSGNYKKISEPLDEKQIDQRVFIKVLTLQNIGFDVSTKGKGSFQQLTIQPFGLSIDNQKITKEIEGFVTNAEIEDLNSDGFPELLIYTTSAGSGSYGNVIGYSVNAGKSISDISFPQISDNPKANKGYMGHDEFAIVETTLVQRFKIYKDGDSNSNPSGNIRQIQYKLKDGEASRKFIIDKIIEYPEK